MSNQSKRILLLDDDYESLTPLKKNLEYIKAWQVEITAAASLLTRLGQEKFDLLCVDVMIHPIGLDEHNNEVTNIHFDGVNWRKTGLEFLRQFRSGAFYQPGGGGTPPQTPVILLSALANYSIVEIKAEGATAELYVEKPFSLEDLIAKMSQLLAEPA